MINVWWSVGLTVLGGLGWLLVTLERRIHGFAVGIVAQIAWVTYAVVTGQWGFIGSATLFGAINALGVHRWLKARRDAAGMELPCPSEDCPETLTMAPDGVEVRCRRCGCTVRARMAG
jgi:hypothetical protein